MDGIHDLGGMDGFGPVEVEPDVADARDLDRTDRGTAELDENVPAEETC